MYPVAPLKWYSLAFVSRWSYAIAVFLVLGISGCGGGGGTTGTTAGGGNTNGGGISASQLTQAAQAAKLSVSVSSASNTATLSWVDSMPVGTVYDIQVQAADGSFATVASVAASGTGNALTWSQPISATTVYQVSVTYQGQVYLLSTVTIAQTSVTATVSSLPPTIVITPATSPITGTVVLSVSGLSSFTSIAWYCDTTALGSTGAAFSWNTGGVANGTHLLTAIVQISGGSSITISQQIVTANTNLTVNASVVGNSGTVYLNASASSTAGIASVSAVLNGTSLGSLTSPNACTSFCAGVNNVYQFTINGSALGSGSYSAVVTATDTTGASVSQTVTVNIANPPVLTITAPIDGAYINGTGNLVLNGTATSDRSGAVTVSASLGALPLSVNLGTGGSFTSSLSLSGLPSGSYTLTVNATDSGSITSTKQLSLVISSSSQTTYAPAGTLGSGVQMLSANGGSLLIRAADGSFRVVNPSGTSHVLLAGATAVAYVAGWELNGGNVWAYGVGPDCTNYWCIYQWDSNGVQHNLSNADPYARNGANYDVHVIAHDGYAVWTDDLVRYTVYNLASNTYAGITLPSNISRPGNWNYDFYVANGNLTFFYWGEDGGAGTASNAVFDVFSWSSGSNTSTQITNQGMRNIYTQTDGATVAWQQTPASGSSNGLFSLISMPVASLSPQTVTDNALAFYLNAGVLAWTEASVSVGSLGMSTTTITAIKAMVAGTVNTITTDKTASLIASSGGDVVYTAGNKLYAWNSTSQSSSLLSDAIPAQMQITAKTLYCTQGNVGTLYVVPLP